MSKPLTDVDPNVRIPAAVKAAAVRAEEEHKKVYSEEPAPESENPAPEPAKEPAKEPANDNTETPPAANDNAVPPAAVTPEGNPPQPANPSTPAPAPDSWEHKYNSMKGRYERAEKINRQLTERLAALEATVAAMSAQPPAPPPAATELRAERLITPKEEEEYGTEFLDVVKKASKEELLPIVAELQKKVEMLTGQLKNVGDTVVSEARKRMWATLDERVPNWREINEDPNFYAWLQLPETYSGAIRHTLLKDAYDRNDTARVLAFFQGFLAEEAALAPQETRGPDPAPAQPPAGKVPLEAFAAPGRAKTAAATAPAEKPIITRAQIATFYADKAAGKYRGKEAEADRLERMIFEAQRDGRIQ